MGGRLGTPTSCPVSLDPKKTQVDLVLPRVLGFVRIVDGVIASEPYWVSSGSAGAEIGALATGAEDITDVAGDVSAHHARVWYEAADAGAGRWMLSDLGSSNGTVVVDGDGSAPLRIAKNEAVEIHPGDEVRLGSRTTFVLVEGAAEMAR
ncbi:FHA domain-containing protein [Collinsella intestinalis]